MNVERVFNERKDGPLFNTSYPLSPDDWRKYISKGPMDFSTEKELSFYVHIPFCQHLCKFCEYTRTKVPKEEVQKHYVSALMQDIIGFLSCHPSVILNGFDIGGGTPTALCDEAFEALMNVYIDTNKRVPVPHTCDFEPSIEATFQTVSHQKAQMIVDAGFRRVSLGIQSSVQHVQQRNGRQNSQMDDMVEKMDILHKAGIQKVNIDIMYGLEGQTVRDVISELDVVKVLNPEQVTLYELRTNMLSASIVPTKQDLYDSYCALYDGLTSMGYGGHVGQNTFSKNKSDYGLSSYLRHRMLDFSAYKGFGISAQSLSNCGLSYNVGKQHSSIDGVLSQCSYQEEFVYKLPPHELFAKYVSISAYCGQISAKLASKILNDDFMQLYRDVIDFCLSNEYMSINGDVLRITKKGFIYYGAVFSLFSAPVK